MRLTTVLLATALTAGFASAAAADGWYFSAGTGINYVPDMKLSNTRAAGNPTSTKSDIGMVIVGAVGYSFDPIRVEGEFGWRDNGFDKITTPLNGRTDGQGDFQPVSLMANVYYDFKTGTPWTPYVGVGVGAVDLIAKLGQGGQTLVDNSATGLGYQGILGVAYKLNDALSIKADYRYLGTTDIGLSNSPALGAGTATASYESHSVLVGFIYRFGAAAAPMPETAPPAPMAKPAAAAPAPAPAAEPAVAPAPMVHQFVVFFDFDKSEITPEARQIIEQAAAAAKAQGTARIDLTGHTDTVGSEGYNQKLSVRRAAAVKKVLVELGVAANEIGVTGKGKTELLVQTPDGVREPKNRRVEIVLP